MDTRPAFLEKHSLAIRLWHWIFFLTLTGTLVTVLLASTTFRTRNNTAMVMDQLAHKGVTVTQDQARMISHSFNDKLWDLHTLIGYVICGLLLSRMLIEVFQPGDEKLRKKIADALRFRSTSKEEMTERQHYLWVKWGYVVFYGLILIMALTGLGLAFENVPFLKGLHGTIKQIHSFTQYLIYAYILLHLAGVIRTDRGKYAGLVSRMIHGRTR
ncbi:MAG TPA: cytochrome b/b6 domain-containing protein [Puia sp.]|jgi:cytochrome b561